MNRVLTEHRIEPLALIEIGSQFTPEELAERAHQPSRCPSACNCTGAIGASASVSLPAEARQFVLLIAA